MRWHFAKYVGCGNDFILIDNRQNLFPTNPVVIQKLCHRQMGIGADGVLLLENHAGQADCCMRIFNSDGSEAEMCGNGLRCFAKWLDTLGFNHTTYQIEVMKRLMKASREVSGLMSIDMGEPLEMEWNIPFHFNQDFLHVHYMIMGVPHALFFVDDIEQINLANLGPYIRYHPRWQPKGTNVTAIQQSGPHYLKIRTYERGVEAETFACGTGATAAALAAAYLHHLKGPITIETRSGEHLLVNFSLNQEQFANIILTGPAQFVFKGDIELAENGEIPSFSIACNSKDSVKS